LLSINGNTVLNSFCQRPTHILFLKKLPSSLSNVTAKNIGSKTTTEVIFRVAHYHLSGLYLFPARAFCFLTSDFKVLLSRTVKEEDPALTNTTKSSWVHRIVLFILWPVSLFCATSSLAWEGRVTGVTDGTYITVTHDGKGERVRLYGIDCPEKRQEFSQEAKKFTSDMVQRKAITVEPVIVGPKGHTKDQYGRTVALVYVHNFVCLNEELIKAGLAWVFTQSCTRPECKTWKELETQAKRRQLGLWSMLNPIPPWEFRQSKGANIPIYHGDVLRHVFHSSNCEEFDCPKCIAVFKGREQALKAGYKPCGVCNP
jgi:endonuclease YncB( thermonuclease family)